MHDWSARFFFNWSLRSKGGFYFFFFNYYRSDVSVSFASGVLCALSPLAQFLLSLVVPHGMRVCRPSAALCASIASMFIVRHLMPVFPSFVSAAFYAAGLFFDNPITRSVDLSGSPIPAYSGLIRPIFAYFRKKTTLSSCIYRKKALPLHSLLTMSLQHRINTALTQD